MSPFPVNAHKSLFCYIHNSFHISGYKANGRHVGGQTPTSCSVRKVMVKVSVSLCFVVALAAFGFIVHGSVATNYIRLHKEDKEIKVYELRKGDLCAKFTNWGATIISVFVPDKDGKTADVVLGYDSADDYKRDETYFGATVGRVANRIAGAKFTLNGTEYKLVANEKTNTLHGGEKGFSDVVWKVEEYKNDGDTPKIIFSYQSRDGEQCFPGDLKVTVTYTLKGDKEFGVSMEAKAKTKATPVNLAQHAYWNLGGHDSGDILSEEVQIFAKSYTPVDSLLIPTGKIEPVKGTPYDFLTPHPISSYINKLPVGYDINYVLDRGDSAKKMRKVAIVHDKKSGRVMELSANKPGVQFYTGGQITEVKGKGGFVYKKYAGLCLETQAFPDAVHHPNFPNTILEPGQTYKHEMLYRFFTKS